MANISHLWGKTPYSVLFYKEHLYKELEAEKGSKIKKS